MTYYTVIDTYDDKGKVNGWLGETVQAEIKPEMEFFNGRYADVYINYFETLKDAEIYLDDMKNA